MTIGSMLREQREKLGLDLASMATYLRIRLPYLQAMENDAFDQLPPGNAYRIGFIKSYAAALNLDVDQAVARYRSEQDASQKMPLRVRMPLNDSSGSTIGLIALLAALIVAGWVAWSYMHHSKDRTVADAVPDVPDRLQPQAQIQPAPQQTVAPAPAPDSAESDEAHDEPDTQPVKAAPVTKPAPQQQVEAPAARVLNDASTADQVSHVEIVAVDDSWVQIRNAEQIVYTGIMHAGDTYKVPDQRGWSMTAGNAAGITLTLDGRPGEPLGPAGAVIRDVPLDTAIVTAGHP